MIETVLTTWLVINLGVLFFMALAALIRCWREHSTRIADSLTPTPLSPLSAAGVVGEGKALGGLASDLSACLHSLNRQISSVEHNLSRIENSLGV